MAATGEGADAPTNATLDAWAERTIEALKADVDLGVEMLVKTRNDPRDVKSETGRAQCRSGIARNVAHVLSLTTLLERLRESRCKRASGARTAGHGNEDRMVDHRRDEWDDLDTAALEAELRSRLERIERMREAKQRDDARAPGAAAEHGEADAGAA
ncbi:hypothetical protein ASG17_13880 [Brevundimonas sp. Leaf363]|nr:hypothetical protein ASG17_13880 [Brevundimonas sp. Leaf363]